MRSFNKSLDPLAHPPLKLHGVTSSPVVLVTRWRVSYSSLKTDTTEISSSTSMINLSSESFHEITITFFFLL